MIQIYGIKNCDTIKKTLNWFEQQGARYDFIDYKKSPPTAEQIQAWLPHVGWEALVNKRGTTWRRLPDADKADLTLERAIELMVAHPSLIKRPVVTQQGLVTVGYNEAAFKELLALQD
jgi:Spx/MgsR family transcriptional regulator